MKYFLTGATGFIGGRIARQLREAGHEVVALVRTPAKARALAEMGVTLAPGDITERESMRAPMAGADGVFHIAAWYEVGTKDTTMAERINVQGTRNVLELMRELAIPKGVYTSTVGVFSDTEGRVVDESFRYQPDGKPWISEYERTKWQAHYEVAEPMQRAGLPLVIVHPGVVYGPGDASAAHQTFQQYLQRRLPIVPPAAFCWAHVEDTARGHILAMELGKPGENYIIGGQVHTVGEVLAMAERITGVPAPRLRPSKGMVRGMASLMDLVGKVAPLPPLYTGESLRSTSATYIASNAKAKRELGFDPRPLEAGLRETLAWEQSNG